MNEWYRVANAWRVGNKAFDAMETLEASKQFAIGPDTPKDEKRKLIASKATEVNTIYEAAANADGASVWFNQGLAYPMLSQMIVETPFEGFPMRSLFALISTPNNPTVMIPRENGSSAAFVTRTAEGAEVALNFAPLIGTQCTCYKVAEGFMVTSEMQRYPQIPVIPQRMRHLAFKMKHTENVDIITAIGAGVPGANVVVATGASLGHDGTQFTIAGTIGQYDIMNAIRILMQNYKGITSKLVLLMNPVGYRQVGVLPMFSSYNQYDSPAYKTGFRGMIEGCDVVVSNDVPAGVAYIIATDPLSYPTGQYTPVGYFIESRPIETKQWERPDKDAYIVYAYHEYTPCVAYAQGITQITYTGYS